MFGVTISVGLLGHGATLMTPVVVNPVMLTPQVVGDSTTVHVTEAPETDPGVQSLDPAAPLNVGELVGATRCCLASFASSSAWLEVTFDDTALPPSSIRGTTRSCLDTSPVVEATATAGCA